MFCNTLSELLKSAPGTTDYSIMIIKANINKKNLNISNITETIKSNLEINQTNGKKKQRKSKAVASWYSPPLSWYCVFDPEI